MSVRTTGERRSFHHGDRFLSDDRRPSRFRLLPILAGMIVLIIAIIPPSGRLQAATADYLDTIQRMYIGYYGRPADYEGMSYWAAQLERNNGNMGAIMEAFVNSSEFVSLYGSVDDNTIAGFVDRVYTTLFNRPAEEAGKAYYVDAFNMGGFTPATLAANIMYGAQGLDALTIDNKVIAAKMFTEAVRSLNASFSGDVYDAADQFLSQVTYDPGTLPSWDETIQAVQAIAGITDRKRQVTLAWDPNQEPEVAGYKVYVGNAPGDYRGPSMQGTRQRSPSPHSAQG